MEQTCLQIHNDYLIPGGETKSVHLIGKVLEENGYHVIRYYKNNKNIPVQTIQKILTGFKSLYNTNTIKELEEIISHNDISFAIIHNISPLISNSVYDVLHKHHIPIIKYIQNYNLLCLNGALDHGKHCKRCKINLFEGVKCKCYKNSLLYSIQKYIQKKIFDKKYKDNINAYIAISNFVKQKHIEYGIPSKLIHTIYHFIDNPYNIEDKFDYNKFNIRQRYVLYMGRLSQEKGILTLLQTFKSLPDFNLKIMGTGDLKNKLQEYVNKEKLNNISFLGFCSGETKSNLISQAYALIVPSEWDEPFGRIVIEAYQYGTPVIVTDRGGLPELVNDGITGYIYKCKDCNDLRNKILTLMNLDLQSYHKLRQECIKMTENNFTSTFYIRNINRVINSITTIN